MKQLKYKEQVVVTTSILADKLGTDDNSLKVNFNRNKARYVEGVHYFLLKGIDLKEFKRKVTNCNVADNVNQLYLWTEKGAFNHVKSVGTDEAWDAYQTMVDTYFRVKALSETIPKALTALDLMQMTLDQLKDQSARIENVESEVKQLAAHSKTRSDYFTIVGYASLNDIQIGLNLAASLGKKASAICKANGYEMEEIPDPRFGRVKTYPYSVLQQVFTVNLT